VSIGTYIDLRTKATILAAETAAGYDLSKAESNPLIFEEFVGDVLEDKRLPAVIWEPFAGHTGRSRTQDFAHSISLRLISFDISPMDERVMKADSTVTGPEQMVGGVYFHPPYFGGYTPLSNDERELSLIRDWNEYIAALKKTVRIASLVTVEGGLVCAIGRDYRYGGKRIRLSYEYVKMFEDDFFKIHSVMESEPDVAIVFRRAGV
jgi:hypothetical protein